jgi:hypothetical protein
MKFSLNQSWEAASLYESTFGVKKYLGGFEKNT